MGSSLFGDIMVPNIAFLGIVFYIRNSILLGLTTSLQDNVDP